MGDVIQINENKDPREFWVRVNKLKNWIYFTASTQPLNTYEPDQQIVHVIEKSAYDAVVASLKDAIETLKDYRDDGIRNGLMNTSAKAEIDRVKARHPGLIK